MLLAGCVIAGVIAVTQAQRKIPVQYAQRAVAAKFIPAADFVYAVARQLRGRHADHLRPGDSDVPAEVFPVRRHIKFNMKFLRRILHSVLTEGACSLPDPLRVDDPVLLLFLGGDPVQRIADRG